MSNEASEKFVVRAFLGLLASFALPGCAESRTEVTPPLVILLLDTSGSLERKVDCECATPSCLECLPDCASDERSRWIDWIEVLTGTYQAYACEGLIRTEENGATFDRDYQFPHFKSLSDEQADDGLLDLYRDRLRFGLATFDSQSAYVDLGPPWVAPVDEFDFEKSESVDGMWSYNPERELDIVTEWGNGWRIGEFRLPDDIQSYYMDTGIRGPQAESGAVIGSADVSDMVEANMRIQESIRAVRPYGSTPIAAALVDLRYWLSATYGAAVDDAKPYVVLITDGRPDDDYRSSGCDCARERDPSDPGYCRGALNDPSEIHCPYPTAEEAAYTLHCGDSTQCTRGVAHRLDVVGYEPASAFRNVVDVLENVGRQFISSGHTLLESELNSIAVAGGSVGARMADDPQALRDVLRKLFDEIESAHARE